MTQQQINTSPQGPTFSRIVAGCMKWGVWGANLSTQDISALIQQCIETGVTTFDHADIYGHNTTEGAFGEALQLQPNLRQKMQIVTKCGIKLVSENRPQHKIKSYDTSKQHIIWSVENSLKELQTNYIDLFLIHRPSPLMNPHEIAEAFAELKASGKVLHFGVSNFNTTQFETLNQCFPLVTNQIQASVLHLQPFLDGTLDQCLQHKVAPMAWSPLGGGTVFSDVRQGQSSRVREVANDLALKYEVEGLDQILLAFLLKHPSNILPVLGTSKIHRIQRAVEALQIELTREEWFELWEASMGEEVP
ncbi:MAG: aldo/keto reductase [Chitinophagales bacterium]